MKLIIIGSNGQLGTDLMHRCRDQGIEAVGADLPDCDITDSANMDDCLDRIGPVDAVINAAAITDVDGAEKSPEKAFAVNRNGAGHLAGACARRGNALIHVSTDYVFDGSILRPYLPSDPVKPLCVYARSKAEGEALVRNNLDRHVIVRTSWLFGLHGPNFVKTMLRLGAEKENLTIVDDQVGCPTYSGDLAEALLQAASAVSRGRDVWGTYHFCNQGALTWYAFARRIFALVCPYETLLVRDVIPILASQYPLPAARPQYSVLDCASFDNTFGVRRRPYDQALKEMLVRLYEGNPRKAAGFQRRP